MRTVSRAVLPAVSVILILFSGAGILLETAYRNNATVEVALCRWRICDTAGLLDRARAARLEPGPAAARAGWESAREALGRDAGYAFRWCDAGEALLTLGESRKAEYALRRAVALAPDSPPVLIQAAGFWWRTGRERDALALSARILALVRDYDEVVFLYYDRSHLSTDELLRAGIPEGAEAARAFFAHTLSRPDGEAARVVWRWLGARGYTSQALAVRYTDALLGRRSYAEAAAVWRDWAGETAQGGSLLFNGGFEREFSGTRLDWNLSRAPGVGEARDRANARAGTWSLRIAFDGTSNPDYRGVSETAVVAPGTYRLRAWVKSEGITTDQGVFLRVFDPESPRLDARTPAVTGTTDWLPLETTFTVPAGTSLAQIQTRREPSWKFDNKVSGTLWLDEVGLVRIR